MPALKFISEIVSSRSMVLLSNTRQPIAAAVVSYLSSRKDIGLHEVADINVSILPASSIDVVIHFAGFDKPSLSQTLHHTSSLHRLMDYCLQKKAKFILVLPANQDVMGQTAITLTRQFGKNFSLNFTIITVPSDLSISQSAKEIVRNFVHNFEPAPEPVLPTPPIVAKTAPVVKKSRDPYWAKLVKLIVVVVVAPWLVFVFGVGLEIGLAVCGYKNIKSGQWITAKNCGTAMVQVGQFLQKESSLAVGSSQFLKLSGLESKDLFESVNRSGQTIYLLSRAGELATSGQFKELVKVMPLVSEQLAYLQADLQKIVFAKNLPIPLNELRLLIAKANLMLPGVQKIVSSNQTWLILLQDSNEIRPTGGFIGNFALAKIEGGEVVDVQLYDTESTDGLLRGQVDPPADFAKVTRQSSWYLRDSNWSPDFSQSAAKAAWFVNKELGQNVDGVVGVNLSLAKELSQVLKTTYDDKAPIKDLAHDLLEKLKTTSVKQKQQIWVKVLAQLEHRQLTIFSFDQSLPTAVVGWGGEAQAGTKDVFYVVDSNVGVNKVNPMIKSNYKLSVEKVANNLNYNLSLSYANSSTSVAWPMGDYANYVRILVPRQMQLDKVFFDGKQLALSSITQGLENGLNSWGVLINVPVGSSKTLTIQSHQVAPVALGNTYRLRWLNQPGQPAIPLTIASGGKLGYNAVLTAPVEIDLQIN